MEAFEARFMEVMVLPERLEAARALGPIHERQVFGRGILMFDGVGRDRLEDLGETRTAGVADVFVALLGGRSGTGAGA
jgi:ABC-2 type transport system ATP-binding protein